MSDNIFERASRNKLRFDSVLGEQSLSVEQLWDLPLETTNPKKPSLDAIGLALEEETKKISSFVRRTTPSNTLNTLRLEIVQHIVNYKLAEMEANRKRAARTEERAKLERALANQEEKELLNLTKEQIRAKLEELDK